MLFMSDEKWKALPKAEQDFLIRAEIEEVMEQIDWIKHGLAVRYAGLIYRLPLCHDWHDNHI